MNAYRKLSGIIAIGALVCMAGALSPAFAQGHSGGGGGGHSSGGSAHSHYTAGGRAGGFAGAHYAGGGYHGDWNVQFPREYRVAGARYVVDEVVETGRGGFYRIRGEIRRLL